MLKQLSLWLFAAIPWSDEALAMSSNSIDSSISCSNITLPALPGFKVLSSSSIEVINYTNPSLPILAPLSFCNLTVYLTHATNDHVYNEIWLPLTGWNGRWQSTGGGGQAAGQFDISLAPAVAAGYAAGSTDAGLAVYGPVNSDDGSWALNPDNSLNWGRLVNFAYRSIHDMTTIGKAAVEVVYGTPATKSYYSGCSTGGRQGYFAAMFYPEDFDGILANAPAINTPEIGGALFWPSLVMNNIVVPPNCVFSAFQNATIAECDPLDGATDGLITDIDICNFDPYSLVGTAVNCPGGSITITSDHAEVVTKIMQGPRTPSGEFLWWGNPPGASFTGLANTTTVNGTTKPAPFGAAENWVRYFDYQNPDYNTSAMTFEDYVTANNVSIEIFAPLFGTEYPDLVNFREAGGKLITFHGLADQYLAPNNTIVFREGLENVMGGADAVNEFYRVFFGPGVGHCAGGYGPFPIDEQGALVKWVEQGVAPDVLPAAIDKANGTSLKRNLCHWPLKLQYIGGDVNLANSFTCR